MYLFSTIYHCYYSYFSQITGATLQLCYHTRWQATTFYFFSLSYINYYTVLLLSASEAVDLTATSRFHCADITAGDKYRRLDLIGIKRRSTALTIYPDTSNLVH